MWKVAWKCYEGVAPKVLQNAFFAYQGNHIIRIMVDGLAQYSKILRLDLWKPYFYTVAIGSSHLRLNRIKPVRLH